MGEINITENDLAPMVAVLTTGEVIAAGQFLNDLSCVRQHLKDAGDRIAIAVDESYLFLVTLVAGLTLKKNLIILPNYQSGTINGLASNFDFLVRDDQIQKYLSKKIGSMENSFTISYEAQIAFYTSGSSGVEKRIQKRFENLYQEILELERVFGSALGGCQVVSSVSHKHIYGFLFKLLWPFFSRRTFYSGLIEYPETLLKLVNSGAPFAFISSPAFLKRYFLPETIINNCRGIYSSGGRLDLWVAEKVKKGFGVWPIEIYGSTESGGIGYRRLDGDSVPFTPFSRVNLIIGGGGEMSVKSPYFDEAVLSLGDLGEKNGSGFNLLGRMDDIVKIEEKRVSLSAMTAQISASGVVEQAVVVDLDFLGRQEIGCVAVLNAKGQGLLRQDKTAEINRLIRQTLADHFDRVVIPRRFRYVEALPINSQAKVIKNEVRRLFNEFK